MNDPSARGAYTWERSFRLWDGYFAIVWAATLVFVLGADDPGSPFPVVSAGLLIPLIPWYVAVGRPLLQSEPPDERHALGYLAGALALFLPSAILVGEARLITFALVAQCFMALSLRRALVAVTLINITPVVGWALMWRPGFRDVFSNSSPPWSRSPSLRSSAAGSSASSSRARNGRS